MESFAIAISKQSLLLVLVLTGPPVLAAMAVGLIVSVLQATTQIQEQTLTFVPKVAAVALVLALLGPLGMAQIVAFTRLLLETFPDYIK